MATPHTEHKQDKATGTAKPDKPMDQTKLDRELKESFPASDPPAATIPTTADRGPNGAKKQ